MSTVWRKKEIAHWPQCGPPFGGRTIPREEEWVGVTFPPTYCLDHFDRIHE